MRQETYTMSTCDAFRVTIRISYLHETPKHTKLRRFDLRKDLFGFGSDIGWTRKYEQIVR